MIGVEELQTSPTWLPMHPTGAGDAFTLVRLDEAAYRAASFLDERLLAAPVERAECSAATVVDAAVGLARRPHFLFHIGHVGSTLISRLVGEHPAFFSLREPMLLRAFAGPAATGEQPLPLATVRGLLARTWRATQHSVVKPTSVANECAASILAAPDRPAAVFMYTDPLTYLRAILGGANSCRETELLAPGRRRRLERRLGGTLALEPVALGERAAMNWLCETTTLHLAAELAGTPVLWMHFDHFLAEPRRGLARILHAFGADAGAAEVAAIVDGPLMRQYSKAPQYAYDAALRREVLMAADVDQRAQIRGGMRWLERIAAGDALARRVLDARTGVSPP